MFPVPRGEEGLTLKLQEMEKRKHIMVFVSFAKVLHIMFFQEKLKKKNLIYVKNCAFSKI